MTDLAWRLGKIHRGVGTDVGIIEELRRDHDLIRRFMESLESVGAGYVRSRVVRRYVDAFIVSFVEDFHHRREEEVLFEHLTSEWPGLDRTVESLVHRHDEGRDHVEGMRLVAEDLSVVGATAWNWHLRCYCALLRSHLEDEESTTLPRIAHRLTSADELAIRRRLEPRRGQDDLTRARSERIVRFLEMGGAIEAET